MPATRSTKIDFGKHGELAAWNCQSFIMPIKDEIIADVRRNARRVPAGTEILLEGERSDYAVWILGGFVSSSKMLSDGRRQIIDILLPFDIAGNLSGSGVMQTVGVTALTDSVVAVNSRRKLESWCNQSAEIKQVVFSLRRAAEERLIERTLRLGRGSADERLAEALLDLHCRIKKLDSLYAGKIPIKQKDLGDYTGLTAVHVCRTLRKWARQEIVRTGSGGIEILNDKALAAIAEVDLGLFEQKIVPNFVSDDVVPSAA